MIKLFVLLSFSFTQTTIPVTGVPTKTTSFLPSISIPTGERMNLIKSAQQPQIMAIFVNGQFSYPVIQQPIDDPNYISESPDAITQFLLPSRFGSIGLIAHNTLAGIHFFGLKLGDQIILLYDNGNESTYQVTQIDQYQAVSPKDPQSDFIDLVNPQFTLTSDQLFSQIYGIKDRLVLQTCISNGKNDSWGRLFVVAEPYQFQ